MKRNDPQFKEMVARIASGELTRAQAADTYEIAYGTLCVWLIRSGLNKELPKEKKVLAGYAVELQNKVSDPDLAAALDAAVAKVLAGETSALAASRADPRLKHRTISVRVRKARIEQGLPVPFRSPQTK